ncbi:ATP-binding protein [Pseudoduganella ginsengisoli]|uniref:Virulence sensor protein BvgS n=1 Tax=Pseudoduganella ginsengisoli TaxID=1462440 RepID=A0A6L6Q326_9BURK|nr:ATP-binding protein [Pseudoduganella ginsengisoli]MTW04070.1 response regulator [Pseudoduganella ginsengisoli]
MDTLQQQARRRISIVFIVSTALAALVTVLLAGFAMLSYNAESKERWRELHRGLEASADQLTAAIALPAWNFDDRQIIAIVRAGLSNRDLYGCTVTLSNGMQFVFIRNANGEIERVATPPDLPALRTAVRTIEAAGRAVGTVKMYVTPQYVLQTLSARRVELTMAIVGLDIALVAGVYLLLWYVVLKPLKRVGRYAAAVKAGDKASREGQAPQTGLFFGELQTLNESILEMVELLDSRYSAMQASEERLAIATDAANIGIWDWDARTGVLVWDREMHRQYGVPPGSFDSSVPTWEERLLPEDLVRVNRQIDAVRRGEGEYRTEFRIRWPDGQIRYIKAAGRPFRSADGELLRMVGVNYDITEIKMAEHELRRHRNHLEELVDARTEALSVAVTEAKAASRAKSVFLATMSHELRTPLHSVLGFSRLLADSQTMTEEEKRNLAVINRSGQHLLTLINDLLELSKIEAGRITLQAQVVDVEGLLREVMDMLGARARQAGLAMTLDCAGLPRAVRIDGARLRQVLLNLVSNAVKFAEQGSVTLVARATLLQENRYALTLAVRDTGRGIAREDQQRIFEPFVQADNTGSNEGTGLGLTISREFVRMMGGKLEVESELGNGAEFRFSIEVEGAAAAPGEAASVVEALEPSQRGRRILVVDDNEDSRRLIDSLLSPLGFMVEMVADGASALAAMKRCPPALVIMDWRMPGMDGLQVMRRIRAEPGIAPPRLVMMTASAFEEERLQALDAGADEFLCKPIEQDQLFQVLEHQLGVRFRRRQRAPLARPQPLTESALAQLPYDVLVGVKESLHLLYTARALELLESCRHSHPDIVQGVVAMLEQHQYPQLCGMIDAVCAAPEV